MNAFRFLPEARPSTVGFVAVVKVQDCATGRIVLSSKCSEAEFSRKQSAQDFAEHAASLVAWNMNAKRDVRPDGTRYRLRPCPTPNVVR